MLERIVPPDENERANDLLIEYEYKSKLLAAVEEETTLLTDDLENMNYIDSKIKKLMNVLLDKQYDINTTLSDNVDTLKCTLESMGVCVD